MNDSHKPTKFEDSRNQPILSESNPRKTTAFFLKYSALFISYIVAAIIDDLTIYGFSPQLYEYIVYWICALMGHVLFSFCLLENILTTMKPYILDVDHEADMKDSQQSICWNYNSPSVKMSKRPWKKSLTNCNKN